MSTLNPILNHHFGSISQLNQTLSKVQKKKNPYNCLNCLEAVLHTTSY
jgi:hypothetical protein